MLSHGSVLYKAQNSGWLPDISLTIKRTTHYTVVKNQAQTPLILKRSIIFSRTALLRENSLSVISIINFQQTLHLVTSCLMVYCPAAIISGVLILPSGYSI